MGSFFGFRLAIYFGKEEISLATGAYYYVSVTTQIVHRCSALLLLEPILLAVRVDGNVSLSLAFPM
jgi:hypothetical protein